MPDPEKGSTETTPLVGAKKKVESFTSEISENSVWEDAVDTVQLGIPIFIAMLSWVGVRTRFY
jgi:hypothetical protein